MYKNEFYRKYGRNVFSQNGEDGVITEILNRLNIKDGWVCEFGAWDGKHLSNTFNLVKNNNFKAIYIEGDQKKYNDLLETVKEYNNIIPINAYVSHTDSSNNLDNLLKNTDIPIDFDLLSIDIDGFDYHVWNNVTEYKPKLVIIEINSRVVIGHDINHIHQPGKYRGTAFLPMYNLGIKKGYQFVLHTGNMFFIRNDLFERLNISYKCPLENYRPY